MLNKVGPASWDQTWEVSEKSTNSSRGATNLHSSSTRHRCTNQPGHVLYGITVIYPAPDDKYTPQERGTPLTVRYLRAGSASLHPTSMYRMISSFGGLPPSQVRPPLTGPTIGAVKKLAPLRNWQNHPMAGTHLGVIKTSASPAWVDHTSDRLIKGSGRSCLPQGNETGHSAPLYKSTGERVVWHHVNRSQPGTTGVPIKRGGHR
jgi:hypothetical protein